MVHVYSKLSLQVTHDVVVSSRWQAKQCSPRAVATIKLQTMPTLVLSDTWQLPFARGDEKHKMLPHVTCGLLHHLSETQTPPPPPDLGVFVSMVALW